MKSLIVYFSRRHQNYVNGVIRNLEIGNTEIAARMIEKHTNADLFQIEPLQEYSKDYNECIAQAQEDQRRDVRPELKSYPADMETYDTIYLGYPNYWSTMPMAVFTFLEHYDLTGKRICPFCTHEGSGMGSSEADLRKTCPGAVIEKGLAIHGGSVESAEPEIEKWLSSLNLRTKREDTGC